MSFITPLLCVAIGIIVTALPYADDGQSGDPWVALRHAMVNTQIAARGVRDERVLAALRAVPRHEFVSEAERPYAYDDHPLPIGHNQTISQPYIVALMTELARPAATDRALEVGTGSGYQAAVLSRLVARVYSIELEAELASTARERLARLGYSNVVTRQGDGYEGWLDAAPFDIIVVTAAPDAVPPALLAQLKPGGRMVIPVGPVHDVQDLLLIEKNTTGTTTSRSVIPVRFVPLRRGK